MTLMPSDLKNEIASNHSSGWACCLFRHLQGKCVSDASEEDKKTLGATMVYIATHGAISDIGDCLNVLTRTGQASLLALMLDHHKDISSAMLTKLITAGVRGQSKFVVTELYRRHRILFPNESWPSSSNTSFSYLDMCATQSVSWVIPFIPKHHFHSIARWLHAGQRFDKLDCVFHHACDDAKLIMHTALREGTTHDQWLSLIKSMPYPSALSSFHDKQMLFNEVCSTRLAHNKANKM